MEWFHQALRSFSYRISRHGNFLNAWVVDMIIKAIDVASVGKFRSIPAPQRSYSNVLELTGITVSIS